ncbi:hypothetical protein GJA_1132 [Janthinobacterium agaricidamnosum NBRC 102515 = DSM 9628]|uniref:Uncharacterized protein n=1 Tax=Janthinobacterium agaricidamnosum NBRC 102515 = DSM 9628 TaxID=1349767 RepID=W0V1N5_9BURK|nr:hypothetical protein GJA_1132 [Janthinobacterium agaricidamnosum NBRC 102515 = DSM 9628]
MWKFWIQRFLQHDCMVIRLYPVVYLAWQQIVTAGMVLPVSCNMCLHRIQKTETGGKKMSMAVLYRLALKVI